MYSFSYLEPVCCSMSSSNCCFLTCMQISQEAGQVVWYSHLFQNFPQFVVIHTVKGFGLVNKAEIDVFLELSCFFYDPSDALHEIKKMLGIKAMTILDSILKSRDIILLTKVCIVKPMVFPVVTYGCESWTIYDGWAPKHWSFWIVVLEKTLESPLNCKEIKPVKLKGNQPWIIIGRTDSEVKLQYFGHLMWRASSLEKTVMLGKTESRRRRGNRG